MSNEVLYKLEVVALLHHFKMSPNTSGPFSLVMLILVCQGAKMNSSESSQQQAGKCL